VKERDLREVGVEGRRLAKGETASGERRNYGGKRGEVGAKTEKSA